jgi:hypothetical protein
MGQKDSKQIVYRFNGHPESDEVEHDLDGEVLVPERDQMVVRNGKNWKVVQVNKETTVAGPRAIPIVLIFLTDKLEEPGATT